MATHNKTNPIVDLGLGIIYGKIFTWLFSGVVILFMWYGVFTHDIVFLKHFFLVLGCLIVSFVCVGIPSFLLTLFIKCLWWVPWIATIIGCIWISNELNILG